MEFDVLRVDTVDPCLRLGQERESGLRQLRCARWKTRPSDQVPDVPPRPVDVLVRGPAHLDVQGADSLDLDLVGFHRDARQPEPTQAVVKRRTRRPEVKEGGDGHVAGDPADGLEDQRAHVARASRARLAAWACRAISAATNPALNPLSMLTTLTLGAQELSIASSAAIPPREAP